MLAQVIGFTGVDQQGLSGIEFAFDKELKGRDGYRRERRDAHARTISSGSLAFVPAVDGHHVVLTVDANIQDSLEAAVELAKQMQKLGLDPAALERADLLTKGLPASPGAATGGVVFSAEAAEEAAAAGKRVILVRIETSPEDIGGMAAAQGILTARGGMTSHAAVVARGMGKCCVAGAGDLLIDYGKGEFTVNGRTVKEGEPISLDGATGSVYLGEIATVEPELSGYFGTLLDWADEIRRLGVRTNADTPRDAAQAVKFGAEGIGLCRTEHMFFEGDRIVAMREMILADDEVGRREALDELGNVPVPFR